MDELAQSLQSAFHRAIMNNKRKIQLWNRAGWKTVPFQSLQPGDTFRAFDDDGIIPVHHEGRTAFTVESVVQSLTEVTGEPPFSVNIIERDEKFYSETGTIHVDMDGVVADFDAFLMKHMGRTFQHSNGPSDKTMWDFLVSVEDLYFKLDPTPWAVELWEAIQSFNAPVKFLSAVPRRAKMPTAHDQKIRWLAKHKDLFGDTELVIGPYSKDKWKHAKAGDILIDDRADNIADWQVKGGGIPVYFTGIESTIELLDRLR